MVSPTTLETVGEALDHVGNYISVAMLPLYANPIGLAILGIVSTAGSTMRILAAKNENRQWKDFYDETEREKEDILNHLGINIIIIDIMMVYLIFLDDTYQQLENIFSTWGELRLHLKVNSILT